MCPVPSAEDEFVSLYREAAPAVLAWLSLHARGPLRVQLDPEDLLQEVVARAYAGRANFDPERAPFRAWLFGFARNVLYQALEQVAAGGHRMDWSTGVVAEVPDTATSLTRRLARDESMGLLINALDALPEEERLLAGYRGLEGLPFHEVGRLMGITEASASKRWERLRARLRDVGAIAALFAN